MYDLLIQDVTVVDPQSEGVAILPGHDIAVAGQRIAALVPSGPVAAGQGAEVIAGDGMVALPGLISAHAHAAMVHFRGAAEDVPIEEWFNDYIWAMETNLTPDDVYWGALLAAVESIESGVTTVADHYFAMDRVAEAFATSGLRGHLAWTLFGQDAPADLEQAAGIAPVVAMRQAGVAVGLGSDGAASNNTLDILEQMRLAALLQKHTLGDARALPVGAALALATSEGARAIDQAAQLGRLAPGYLADLILLRADGAHMQPVHNLAAALVYSARAGDVDTLVVDGRVLMQGRRLRTLDKATILREVAARAERLRQRGHGRRVQSYA